MCVTPTAGQGPRSPTRPKHGHFLWPHLSRSCMATPDCMGGPAKPALVLWCCPSWAWSSLVGLVVPRSGCHSPSSPSQARSPACSRRGCHPTPRCHHADGRKPTARPATPRMGTPPPPGDPHDSATTTRPPCIPTWAHQVGTTTGAGQSCATWCKPPHVGDSVPHELARQHGACWPSTSTVRGGGATHGVELCHALVASLHRLHPTA